MLAGVWAIMVVGEYSYFMFRMVRPGSISPMPAVVTGLCLSLLYESVKERLAPFAAPRLVNWAGVEVGSLRPAGPLARGAFP